MTPNDLYFPSITLLITNYNRSESLGRLLDAFKHLEISFADIVVSDDCSKPEHLSILKDLALSTPFRLITASKNRGLGHNLNKGQDMVVTPYTLYVQEDFVPTEEFPLRLRYALTMMEGDSSIDITRFYAYIRYPYLKPANEYGFSEMYLPFLAIRYKKIYQYSDHPHLRRSNFPEKFGKYQENTIGDKTEYGMCISFLRNKGKGYFYNDFKGLFKQHNTESEPSTMTRKSWKNSSNFIIGSFRNLYRQAKYNWDIYLKK